MQIDSCASRLRITEKNEFYEIGSETFYFLVPFRFDDEIVVKRKTSDTGKGETVPYKILDNDPRKHQIYKFGNFLLKS